MGKASRLLTIATDECWLEHPKIQELIAKGHKVMPLPVFGQVDLILSESASYWNDGMWLFLDVTIKRAREKKYGKANPRDGSNTRHGGGSKGPAGD